MPLRITPHAPESRSPSPPIAAGLLDPRSSKIYFFDELFDSSEEKIAIGRGYRCQIQLEHDRVSRLHGLLARGKDGITRLEPIASTNGTYIDGERVTTLYPITLRVGMKVRLGSRAYLHAVDETGRAEVAARTVLTYHGHAAEVYGSNALAGRKIGVSEETVRVKRMKATKDESES